MTVRTSQRLGTISLLLGAVPVLALVSWFLFYTPCGHPRRALIEGTMFWGSLIAVPFAIFAAVKEKPRKRAMIGLLLGLVPAISTILLIIAIVITIASGGRGIPGILDVSFAGRSTPLSFETGVFVTTDTKYYDIAGATPEELTAQGASLGPHGFIAETVPYYHWNYTYRMENGSCRIEKVRVETKIIFTYPRWNNPGASPDVIGEWGKRMAQLEQHEEEHGKIDRQAGQDIFEAIAGTPPAASCAELEKELDARAQTVIAKEHAANDEFDRMTDHGRRVAEARP